MKKILLSFTCVIVAIASITFITLVKSNSEELIVCCWRMSRL